MKDCKGITLVALVITIIILLILAGIAIVQLTQNGLFEKSNIAKERTEYTTAKEIVEMKLMEVQTECELENKEYIIQKIAENILEDDKITIKKYYYENRVSIETEIDESLEKLKGIVVSVNQYPKYKFLIGESCKIEGVTKEEITDNTNYEEDKENVFETIEKFEEKLLGKSNEDDDKIPGAYYLYYKGNEYKDIAGEWVNNEKSPESYRGNLEKENNYMIYETTSIAETRNPVCTKQLTMDISSYDKINIDLELMGSAEGIYGDNFGIQILDNLGNVIKQKDCHFPRVGLNLMDIGERKTVSMSIPSTLNCKDVYFGIDDNGYKIKIYSIYLTKNPEFKIMKSFNNNVSYINGDIVGDGANVEIDKDGRHYIHFENGTTYMNTESLPELAGDAEKTIMCLFRTNDTSGPYRGIIGMGVQSNRGYWIRFTYI